MNLPFIQVAKVFCKSPKAGALANTVKFSDIQEELRKQFPDHVISNYPSCNLIAEAFPGVINNVERVGKCTGLAWNQWYNLLVNYPLQRSNSLQRTKPVSVSFA